MKKFVLFFLLALTASSSLQAKKQQPIVVAYIASWGSQRMPDPTLMTHINYAFGKVTDTFDGMTIQNTDFLRKVMKLKEQNPKLKIILSIGGWTAGNFSEMAANPDFRMGFARDCKKAVDEYGLDGIDIDWEYPTSNEAGISCSPDDTDNFTLLMRDLRQVLGKKTLLTIATIADAKFIDFKACMKYLDFVNIMAYDVANPPYHHTTLYRSSLSGRITVDEAVKAHIKAGVPRNRLTLGMPLYGRGAGSNKVLGSFVKTGETGGKYQRKWDDVGKVPYLAGDDGKLVLAYDSPVSLAYKCEYIKEMGLLGGMYWECTEDNDMLEGMRAIWLYLMK
ncbi:MAG: glycoside hydrolase family 18 protein [Prevotella sp.]|nr:glycoside hydrolase family 18 protein [Prevotella sp.]